MVASGPVPKTGERLIPHVVEELAERQPNETFATFHKGDNYPEGWVDLNFQQLAKAVDWSSWWMEKQMGKSTICEVVAYMGPPDMRYPILAIASLKTGHAMLLPSPRNSLQAHLHILRESGCQHFIYSANWEKRIQELEACLPNVRFWKAPEVGEIFAGDSKRYPYEKSFDDAVNERAIIIHSSGSTGVPKLVPMTHGYISVQDKFSSLAPSNDGRRAYWSISDPDEKAFCMNPLFHLMGIWPFLESIFHQVPVVLAPDRPMVPELLLDILESTKPTIAVVPPSFLEEMSTSESGRRAISLLRTIISGGAPLSAATGAIVTGLTRLCTVYGTSEIGTLPGFVPKSRDDWRYIEWHSQTMPDMVPVDEGLYEAVIRRDESNSLQAVFHSFPELQEYRTNDLFTKHPVTEGLWLYEGRRDDIIVLSNGEKFNPIDLEKHIVRHPAVQKALVVGQRRFQSALLLELDWSNCDENASEEEVINEIWPIVKEGNKMVATHGQIFKTHIAVAPKELPFKLTPKGNVRRKDTERDHIEKIESLYLRTENQDGPTLRKGGSIDRTQAIVQQIVSTLLSEAQISPTLDLFSSGLDSLQTLQLVRSLHGLIPVEDGVKRQMITTSKIYQLPTVTKIANFLHQLINSHEMDVGDNETKSSIEAEMAKLVEKYSKDLPPYTVRTLQVPRKHTVILTGSTGFIGSYLLGQLLQDPQVEHIYLLNRSATALERTRESFNHKNLDFSSNAQSKTTFWKCDFGVEKFGLSDQQYEDIKSKVTVIFHNAWKVDFNHTLESFEHTHIRGTRRLIDFCLESQQFPRLIFTSSISTVGQWTEDFGPAIPEIPLDIPQVVVKSGYGTSKHVAERILNISAEKCGIRTTIIRVGQISGPSSGLGCWNPQEWVPSVIKTSKAIAEIPDSLASFRVDWVPVDFAAKAFMDIMHNSQQTGMASVCDVFNLVNPRAVEFKSTLPAVHRHFAAKVVSFPMWVNDLKSRAIESSDEDISEKPALKLLDFLQALAAESERKPVLFETGRIQEVSKTMRELPPVNESLMELYLEQWENMGVI